MKSYSLLFVLAALYLLSMASAAIAAVTSDGSAPVYKPEVLNEVVAASEKCIAEKQVPVVVFDLDSTLLNNAPRNRAIIEEFAREEGSKEVDFVKAVSVMKDEHMAYALEDTMKNIGVTDKKIIKELKNVWYKKFFTDKYVVLDSVYDGAVDYVKKLHSKGVKVVYLTGRDTPDMEKGTIKSLKDLGFPFGDTNAVLLTKPEKPIKDDDFKKTASADILKMGKVIASFDNEPKNVNLFKEVFPGALVVFIETNHNPKAVPVDKTIPWIKSWK